MQPVIPICIRATSLASTDLEACQLPLLMHMLCAALLCTAGTSRASFLSALPRVKSAYLWLPTDRNEPGRKKHPEFSSLPVCRECFDLLGAAAWHLEGDWKDEGGNDKYCRFCAGSAPGGTSTLVHCAQDECKKGFCTGYSHLTHNC